MLVVVPICESTFKIISETGDDWLTVQVDFLDMWTSFEIDENEALGRYELRH
jgi:hypothetical protein